MGLISCKTESTEKERITEHPVKEKTIEDKSICDKCNFDAIKTASVNWNNLTKQEIEKFLCTYDNTCEWTSEIMENRENQNFGIGWDILFVLFDKYFEEYIEIFEENNSISRNYLLTLFSEPAIYDLPHRQILYKLKNIDKKTEFQSQLEQTFEQSVNEGDKQLKEFKENKSR